MCARGMLEVPRWWDSRALLCRVWHGAHAALYGGEERAMGLTCLLHIVLETGEEAGWLDFGRWRDSV